MIVNHRGDKLTQARPADPEALVRDVDGVLIDTDSLEFVFADRASGAVARLAVVLDADEPTQRTNAMLSDARMSLFGRGLRATGECDDLPRRSTASLRAPMRSSPSPTAQTISVAGDDGLRRIPAFSIEAVDTLGAGDVFHGAFALACRRK